MNTNDLNYVQNHIDYRFKNLDLLQQAFIRRSYSKENGGENNEVLEFIGDKVLELVAVKVLTEEFGSFSSEWDDYNPNEDCNEFVSEYQENKLSEIKKRLVEKNTLANCIDELGLAEYLIMGKGDWKNNVQDSPSVKEDLFEAILGAIAVDSDFDLKKLQDSVEFMLNPKALIYEDELNYIQEVQDWALRETRELPDRTFVFSQGIYNKNPTLLNPHVPTGRFNYICTVKIKGLGTAIGYGVSKVTAHEDAAKAIYYYLKEKGMLHSIRDEIDEPSVNMAINQLETLARRGYFEIPIYEAEDYYDSDGNPIWIVRCTISDVGYRCESEATSKKQAKKEAAYKMLTYVLENYEED